jgi:hypothetical protein
LTRSIIAFSCMMVLTCEQHKILQLLPFIPEK